jgi:hypothetical protein
MACEGHGRSAQQDDHDVVGMTMLIGVISSRDDDPCLQRNDTTHQRAPHKDKLRLMPRLGLEMAFPLTQASFRPNGRDLILVI